MAEIVEEIALVSATTPDQDREVSDKRKRHRRSHGGHGQGQKCNVFIRLISSKLFLLWLILFGCLILIAGPLAFHISYALPTAKSRNIAPHLFSEERARDHFSNLTQHGSRVSNTLGDFHSRGFLISQLDRIRSTAKMPLRFELSLQNFTNSHEHSLQNIAVRLSNPATKPNNVPSLMLIAHYDSVEFSFGSSDDGSGVVILLELLSNLVNDLALTFSDVHLIVLFTGAEEMGLQGSMNFVFDHVWRSDIRRFINIDATSCNDKASLLRVRPSQLVTDYARVPRPHANVIAETILTWMGLVDDYDAFSSYGGLFGYDFIFLLDSYIYHTSLDHSSMIKRGVLQDLGDNVHALARDILLGHVDLQQPKSIIHDDRFIYFDILSRYLIVYRMHTAKIIQWILFTLILVVGIMIILFDHIWHQRQTSACIDSHCIYINFEYPFIIRLVSITVYFISNVFSLIAGLLFAIIFELVLSRIRPLTWFGNSTLAMFLFSLPCLIGIIVLQSLFNRFHIFILRKWSKKPVRLGTTIEQRHVNRASFHFEHHLALLLIYALMMIVSIRTEYRALYIILMWSIFVCPIYLILMVVEFNLHWKEISCKLIEQRNYWLFLPFIISLVPLMHTLEISSRLLRIFIPAMGRVSLGSPLLSNTMICSLVAIPTTLSMLIFIPTVQRTKQFGRTLIVLFVVLFIVVIFAYNRSPYTSIHSKLFYAKHVSKSIFKVDRLFSVPFSVPLESRSASITVTVFDGLDLSPLLDRFSVNSGHKLHNRQCSEKTNCTFDDTFNRTIAVQHIEIESMANFTHYTVVIRHVLSYNIRISSSSFIQFTVRDQFMKPRINTVIDVVSNTPSSPFTIDIKIERCDFADSPFLLLFTQTISNVVIMGTGSCQFIEDDATLNIDTT